MIGTPDAILEPLEVDVDAPDLSADVTEQVPAQDRHFETSHLNGNLKSRTIQGGAVTLSAQGLRFLLRFGSTAILARILAPADFGLIAMVTVITSFLEMFNDAGLSMATVQREKITNGQVSTLFWINIALGIVVTVVVAALAPVIAWFYGEPRLCAVTLVLAGTMIFGGFSVQHQALLRRNMQFSRLAIIDIVSLVAGIVTAILMAWAGFTYWSLVGMTVATAVATAILSVAMTGWLPGGLHWDQSTREMVVFGVHLTGSSFFSRIASQADNLLIGIFWGPVALALYDRSYQLMMLPSQQIERAAGSVVIPTLCRIAGDAEALRRAIARSQILICLCVLPGLAAVIVYSDVVIELLLGDRWRAAVPLFRALSGVSVLMCLSRSAIWIFIAKGQAQQLFRYNLIGAVTVIIAFLIGIRWGALGVAVALLLQNMVWTAALVGSLRKLLDLPIGQLLIQFLAPLGMTALMIAAGWLWRIYSGPLEMLPAILQASLFAISCYASVAAIYLLTTLLAPQRLPRLI